MVYIIKFTIHALKKRLYKHKKPILTLFETKGGYIKGYIRLENLT